MNSHSLIFVYRNRHDQLDVFIDALDRQHGRSQWEIICVQWNPTDYSHQTFERFPWVKVHTIGDTEVIPRSYCLNYGVNKSNADYLTFIDVDCIAPPYYLQDIVDFYAVPKNKMKRLGNHIRFLDQITTSEALRNVDPVGYLDRRAFSFPDRFYSQPDRYLSGPIIGNSKFSISGEVFNNLGGYHEGFVGWGPEDVEFSMRYFTHYRQDVVMDGTNLFHLHHDGGSYNTNQAENQQLFKKCQADHFPKLKGQKPCADTSDKSSTNITTTATQFSS